MKRPKGLTDEGWRRMKEREEGGDPYQNLRDGIDSLIEQKYALRAALVDVLRELAVGASPLNPDFRHAVVSARSVLRITAYQGDDDEGEGRSETLVSGRGTQGAPDVEAGVTFEARCARPDCPRAGGVRGIRGGEGTG